VAAAELSTRIFSTPDSIMRLAALLHAAGRTDDARAAIDRQRANWPNIDVTHFAGTAIPRRCHEGDESGFVVEHYASLARAVKPAR